MRGKRGVIVIVHVAERIIPAHAGQTKSLAALAALAADHPRACGANRKMMCMVGFSFGSSPRMRGKLVWVALGWRPPRIIPAHAGQTSCQAKRSRDCSDHPRACGANGIPSAPWSATHGSSPRMRGEPITLFSCSGYERIIPAHAGQTSWCWRTRRLGTDHPRACGANLGVDLVRGGVTGSSPRMRGKRRKLLTDLSNIRIIPAHAGQTRRTRCS